MTAKELNSTSMTYILIKQWYTLERVILMDAGSS